MPYGTTSLLLKLMQLNNADLIYGQVKKTNVQGENLIKCKVTVDSNAIVNKNYAPLETVLLNSFSRMTFMVKKNTFVKAAGADERIFIQDESLPLRLAAVSKLMLTLKSPVLFVPLQCETLSSNKSQLNHDRF